MGTVEPTFDKREGEGVGFIFERAARKAGIGVVVWAIGYIPFFVAFSYFLTRTVGGPDVWN